MQQTLKSVIEKAVKTYKTFWSWLLYFAKGIHQVYGTKTTQAKYHKNISISIGSIISCMRCNKTHANGYFGKVVTIFSPKFDESHLIK